MNKIKAIKFRQYTEKVERNARPRTQVQDFSTTAAYFQCGCYKVVTSSGEVHFNIRQDAFELIVDALNLLQSAYEITANADRADKLTEAQRFFLEYFGRFSRASNLATTLYNVFPSFDHREKSPD